MTAVKRNKIKLCTYLKNKETCMTDERIYRKRNYFHTHLN